MNFKLRYVLFLMLAVTAHAQTNIMLERVKEVGSKKCAEGDAEACLVIECINGTGDKTKCQALEKKSQAASKAQMTTMIENSTSSEDKAKLEKLSLECKAGNRESCMASDEIMMKNIKIAVEAEIAKLKAKCDAGDAASCKMYEDAKALTQK
jgi:hypothetical protein